ncbi:MAG: type II restriction endonuclease, partial [Dialister invisus]|nr:type II restriction endonuclease [Dialister invisus]
SLYHAPDYTDNAKHIADTLSMEYRALNAAVGWAGNKIRDRYESGAFFEEPARTAEKKKVPPAVEAEKEFTLTAEEAVPGKALSEMAPWQYIFDGEEDEYGAYLWILKPEMAAAFRELEEAEVSAEKSVREALAADISSFGTEGNLFSSTADETVEKIRKVLEERSRFFRKSLSEKAECCVCGIHRLSLLKAVPYGEGGMKHKGLVLCPIHAALFAAHLISFSDRGKVLVSPSVTEEEKEQFGLTKGMDARYTFSRRRMAVHRRIFNQKGRKEK